MASDEHAAGTIEDPSGLCGETLYGNTGEKIGEIRHVYGPGEEVMWVSVSIGTGVGRERLVLVPLARLKQAGEQVRTPYTVEHLLQAPEVDADEELSEQDDQALRNYFAIGLADHEVRTDNESYAAQIPDSEEASQRIAGQD